MQVKLVSGKFSLVKGPLGVTEGSVTEGEAEVFVVALSASGTTVVETFMLPDGATTSDTLSIVVVVEVLVVVVVVALSLAVSAATSSATLSGSVSSTLVVVVAGVVLELDG